MKKLSEVELAYAAGIFDGEGSVSIPYPKNGNGQRYHKLQVSLASTDPRILLWLKERFGGNILAVNKIPIRGRKPANRWACANKIAAEFLEAIQPYLILKAEHTDIALAFRQTIRIKAGMVNGQHGTAKDPVTAEIAIEREDLRQKILSLNKRGA